MLDLQTGDVTTREGLWSRGLGFLQQQPKLAVLLSGLAIATLSLGTWVGALFLENKVLRAQLAQQQNAQQDEDAEALKTRLADAQQQMAQIKTRMEQQQTEEMMDNRDALVAENARLLQELGQLSKPQLGIPLVNLEPASLKQAGVAQKKDIAALIEVPYDVASFAVVLQQAQDKGYQSYFVELLEQKSKNVLWSEQLKKASGPSIPLSFAKHSHNAGRYRIKLYGMNGKKKEFIDLYELQLDYLPDPALKKAAKTAKKR
jgi:hypothetical protein